MRFLYVNYDGPTGYYLGEINKSSTNITGVESHVSSTMPKNDGYAVK